MAGGSGGPLIVSATLQALARVLLYGQSAEQAVFGPRLHNQFLPNTTSYEQYSWGNVSLALDAGVVQELAARGQLLQPAASALGVAQLVLAEDGAGGQQQGPLLTGVCDPRKDGAPAAPAA